MSQNKGYYLQSDQTCMDLYYLEYDGERAPENIQFIYDPSNIHDLEELIGLLNEKNKEVMKLNKDIEILDSLIAMLDRRNKRQAKHLEKIYNLIQKKDWMALEALYRDTKQDYEEII